MNDQPFSLDKALECVPEPGPERDKAIAQTWMGYSLDHYATGTPERWLYVLVDQNFDSVAEFEYEGWPGRTTEAEAWADCPRFSQDIAAAYQMEEVIAQKGRTATYAQALAVVFLENKIPEHEEDMWFLFAHATPEQRSKAALVAWMKGVSHPQEGE